MSNVAPDKADVANIAIVKMLRLLSFCMFGTGVLFAGYIITLLVTGAHDDRRVRLLNERIDRLERSIGATTPERP